MFLLTAFSSANSANINKEAEEDILATSSSYRLIDFFFFVRDLRDLEEHGIRPYFEFKYLFWIQFKLSPAGGITITVNNFNFNSRYGQYWKAKIRRPLPSTIEDGLEKGVRTLPFLKGYWDY